MHKSKFAGFIIDCQTDDLESAGEFWSAALGMERKRLPAVEGEKYMRLLDPVTGLHIEVQKVQHESRVHLDIETDNIEAEVARLEACGARVIEQRERWCVMEAPTGQRFCVVRQGSENFEEEANRW